MNVEIAIPSLFNTPKKQGENGTESHLGIPQGSILGPLLFIITSDSVSQVSISTLRRFSLFADDICYYRRVSQQEDIIAVQNVDLIYCMAG